MKSAKLLSILAATRVVLFNVAIVAAQSTSEGKRGQEGGGIVKLLQQAGATREQIEEFNDARSELRNAPNFRAALLAKLKSILSEQQYKKFEEVWRNRGQGQSENASGPTLPTPTHADVVYGPHPRNVLDLWLARSDKPTPLLVNIHGGGFQAGDKSKISGTVIEMMRKEGISVASINYRFKEGGKSRFEGEKPQYPAILHDGARALQFLRYHAAKYNLDKTRFAATGGSAGAQMLMWLGFHPDLADPDHNDPVLRESSRLQVLAPRGGQTCVHYPTLLKWFGVKSLNLSKREGTAQSSSEVRQPTEKALALSLDASPITHLTKDAPPIYLYYSGPNEPVDEETLWPIWVHHPIFGIKLEEAMSNLGMECQPSAVQRRPTSEGI